MLDGKDRDDRLDGASSAEQVTKLRFTRTDGGSTGATAKDRFDRGSLDWITGRSASGMGVDVVNVAWVQASTLEGKANRPCNPFAILGQVGDVVGIGGGSIAHDLS